MSGATLADRLARTRWRLRAAAGVAVALAVVAVAPAVLLAAWGVGGWRPGGAGPLVLVLSAAAAATALAVVLGARWVAALDEARVAAAAERAGRLPDGSLRGILELGRELPDGVSAALYRHSAAEASARTEGWSTARLSGELGARSRGRIVRLAGGVAVLFLLAVLAGFGTPERARAAWTPLLRPAAHLTGPGLPALGVSPGDTTVDRGDRVAVDVDAGPRRRVVVAWRSVGEVPGEREVAVEEGRARLSLGPVDAETRYWAEADDGAVSDTFRLLPRDPLLVGELEVTLTYPPHTGRSPDRYRGDAPPLRVPEGARLTAAGRATGGLAAAALNDGEGRRWTLEVDGRAFRTARTLRAGDGGVWHWEVEGADGGEAVAPAPLEIRVVRDEAPRVRLLTPGADTILPPTRRQPVVATAADDYGLADAALVFRRVDARGRPGEATVAPLPLAGAAGRATMQGLLDAGDLPLVAGDLVEYHVEVRDNAPEPGVGRSATYRLRLPGLAERRDRAGQLADAALGEATRLAERSRELARSTRELSRTTGSPGRGRSAQPSRGGSPSPELSYDEAAEAERVAREQAELSAGVEALRERVAALERAVAEAGLRDPELARRMEELQELLDAMAPPELQRELASLQQAAQALDPEAVRQALERLAEQQETLREQVERSLEMMRRAAAEQKLASAAREAEEIAARQQVLAEAMEEDLPGRPDSTTRAQPGSEPLGSEPPDATPADSASVAEAGSRASEAASGPPDAGSRPRNAASSDSAGADPAARTPGGLPTPQLPELSKRVAQQGELEERAERLGESLQSLQQQLLQVGAQESASRTGTAREQGTASQSSMGEAARQARQQEGSAAAQAAARAAQQMSDAAGTLDGARRQMGEASRRESEAAVRQATREALELAQRQESLRQRMSPPAPGGEGAAPPTPAEQAVLQQGLEQLGRNLSEPGRQSGRIDPEVGRSLESARAAMEETLRGLEQGGLPRREAGQAVESLNRLAMSLLENEAAMQRARSPGGMQQALEQLARAAREQGALNSQTGALAPMDLGDRARTRQLRELAQRQRGLGRRVGSASRMLGGREDVLGQLDQLSAEADQIAAALDEGRLTPEVRARQERLFHRLLDAGRSLERDEYSDERVGRAAGSVEPAEVDPLDPALLEDRLPYPPPTAAELDRLPPAYRRLILDYFERLNRAPGGGAR